MKRALFFTLLFCSFSSHAQISLIGVEYRGSGCPQGHVSAVLAPDGSAFSILYDAFDLRAGGDVAQVKATCSVVLHLKKPKHLGFRIDAADFRGFVGLDSLVTASQNIKLMSGPNRGHQRLSAKFGTQMWLGPIAENYLLRAVRPINNRPPVLDCVPPKEYTDIVVESQIQISNAGGEKYGQLTVDSVDGLLIQRFYLSWIDCRK